MQLSVKRPPYTIPSYSLTGDLLAYLKCGLQYRYHNKGALPPSKPVQLWFGQFIHGVMEEAFLKWSQGSAPFTFPWDWDQHIRPIELEINRRLMAQGLFPPFRLFCPYDGSNNRCLCDNPSRQRHKLIASERAEAAINTWGPHLFPLISEAEIHLQAIRPMPVSGERRADYYEVTGIADVIGSFELTRAPSGNLILHYLNNQPEVQEAISQLSGGQYEIIVDYKGMRRPSNRSAVWQHYLWQVLTYAWLRGRQPDSAPVIAGIVLFINELIPSQTDMEELQNDVRNQETDVMPGTQDLDAITNWMPGHPAPSLTTPFRERRSIRMIAVNQDEMSRSLGEFDIVVADVEHSVLQEMAGEGIQTIWQSRPTGQTYVAPETRTCTACDFKHYCPLALRIREGGPPRAP